MRLVIVIAGWSIGWWLLWRVPWLHPLADPGPSHRSPSRSPSNVAGTNGLTIGRDAELFGPVQRLAKRCSVIVPARNEEASLATLLGGLQQQLFSPAEIIVIDDQSTDATMAIARSFDGVIVVAGADLPEGWTGKTWACEQGARRATGDVLVFLDADVRLHPEALGALLAAHLQAAGNFEEDGLFSVQPFHHMSRVYERLSALFNIIGFMGVGSASPGRDGRSRGAFGPCLVTSRKRYDEVGGHASVRGEIVEDIALARRYAAAGLDVRTVGGGGLVSFRMYPEGLGQLLEGWSKNFATGARSVAVGRALLIAWWVTTALMSVQFGIEQVAGNIGVGRLEIVIVYLLFVAQFATMLRPLGNFGWLTAVAYPVPLGIFVVVFARSVYLTVVRRRVTWRGRRIPISHSRRWAQTVTVVADE